jgi:hypothetical protein
MYKTNLIIMKIPPIIYFNDDDDEDANVSLLIGSSKV